MVRTLCSVTAALCHAGEVYKDGITYGYSRYAHVSAVSKDIADVLILPEKVIGSDGYSSYTLYSAMNMSFYGCDKLSVIVFPQTFKSFITYERTANDLGGSLANTIFEGCWSLTNAVF